MKRIVGQCLLILAAFILQNTVFHMWSFNGVKPNILLIISVFFGFTEGSNNGMLTGFFCGLLCDIFFGAYIGVYSFLFMLTGAAGGGLAKVFYPDDLIFPYVTIAGTDLAMGLIMYIGMFLIRGRYNVDFYLTSVILPEMIYTVIIGFIMMPVLRKYNAFLKKAAKKEKESDVSGTD